MKPSGWRPALVAACAFVLVSVFAYVLAYTGLPGTAPWAGKFGLEFDASGRPYEISVSQAIPGGPAWRAGIRAGDRIDLRRNPVTSNVRVLIAAFNGEATPLSLVRGAGNATVTVVPVRQPAGWDFWLGAFDDVLFVAFATVIAWRRAHVPQMRLLALLVLSGVFSTLAFPAPDPFASLAIATASTLGGVAGALLWAVVAGTFAAPLSPARNALKWAATFFAAAFAALVLASGYAAITLRIDPVPLFYSPVSGVPFTLLVLTALAASVLAIRASRGIERQQALWTLLPIAIIFCAIRVITTVATLVPLSPAVDFAANAAIAVVVLSAGFALTYAAVSRKLIDIGFVVNRAAVFAIVSTIVIGTFVVVEWAVSEWLVNASHTTGFVAGMIVALAIGLSLRYVHAFVDRWVDRIFFRKRHEDEAALRNFAREASYMTDATLLLDRAVREVSEHTDAESATILVRNGSGYASVGSANGDRVDENDAGILALRAWNKRLDLHDRPDSDLRGDVAFPMISRGALVGVLVCGAKRNGEGYAPDESEALFALAQGVGTTLDVLSNRSAGTLESLASTQNLILEELRSLPGKFTGNGAAAENDAGARADAENTRLRER